MWSPDGQDFCSKCVYRDIVEPEQLVMTDSFANKEENTVAANYGMGAEFPREMLITVTFEEQEGKIKLTLKHSDIRKLNEELNDMQQGWNEYFDKLDELLAKV